MTASRYQTGALIGALLIVIALTLQAPGVRPFAYRVARHFGFVAPPKPISAGQSLGSIPLQTLDGSPISLANRSGHGLLINVFTSWCVPCNQEMPALSRASGELARAGIDVVGIDQAEAGPQVERFVQTYGVHYPVYIDVDGTTRHSLGARVIPTTLFVDRRGVVRYVHVGPLDVASFVTLAQTAE